MTKHDYGRYALYLVVLVLLWLSLSHLFSGIAARGKVKGAYDTMYGVKSAITYFVKEKGSLPSDITDAILLERGKEEATRFMNRPYLWHYYRVMNEPDNLAYVIVMECDPKRLNATMVGIYKSVKRREAGWKEQFIVYSRNEEVVHDY